jgi:hypothetical protein
MTKPVNPAVQPGNINASRVTPSQPAARPAPAPVPPAVKPSGPMTYTVQKGANTLPDFSGWKK